LAVEILSEMERVGALKECSLVDLGCGCGVLMIGARAMGCRFCLGIDVDPDALTISQRNIATSELGEMDILLADVRHPLPVSAHFDTVLMNPPFGTKNNWGIDLEFVRRGLSLLQPGGQLFSLHKTTTRSHILAQKQKLDVEDIRVMAELIWPLTATYRGHKKDNVDIRVDLIRFRSRTIS